MPEAVIVDIVRTAGGRRNGALSGWHPVDLAAETLKALAERNNLDPELVDDVIMGCVMQAGAQALNVGPQRRARRRLARVGARPPPSTASADRPSRRAHFAAQGVMAGAYDVVVAAGVEVMSLVPMGASIGSGVGFPFGAAFERYADVELLPGPDGPGRPGHLGRDHRQRVRT